MAVLRWPIRIASIVAVSVLAYGWGDYFDRSRSVEGAFILGILTVALLFALARLYRPGGMAAFEDAGEERRAPGEAAPEPPGPTRAERKAAKQDRRERERERAARRAAATATAVAPPPPEPATGPPTRVVDPPRRRARESGGSLWSSGGSSSSASPPPSRPPRPPAPDALDLNAASVDELAMLPGIGRGAAARVVARRETHGPFGSVSELASVEGFDASRVARVASRLRV